MEIRMKDIALYTIALVLVAFCLHSTAEVILMKNGMQMEGIVVHEDETHVRIKLEAGEIQLERSAIDRIMTAEEAADWREEVARKKAEKERRENKYLQIIQKGPVEAASATGGMDVYDRLWKSLETLIDPPQLSGNAAQYYWSILDPETGFDSPGGRGNWNFSHPVFRTVRKAAQYRECSLFPEFLPYPSGLWPPDLKYWRLQRTAVGLVRLGKHQIAGREVEEGLRNIEAALIMGVHLAQKPLTRDQYVRPRRMQQVAAGALGAYYASQGKNEKSRQLQEYVRSRDREIKALSYDLESLKIDFNAARFGELIEFVQSRQNTLLRAEAMNLLVLIKLAAEQLPLNRETMNLIPLESAEAFKRVSPSDGNQVTQLLTNIQTHERDGFLRDHATKLLAVKPYDLIKAVDTVLMTDQSGP